MKEKSEKFNGIKVQKCRVIVIGCVCVCVPILFAPLLPLHFRCVVVAVDTLYLRFSEFLFPFLFLQNSWPSIWLTPIFFLSFLCHLLLFIMSAGAALLFIFCSVSPWLFSQVLVLFLCHFAIFCLFAIRYGVFFMWFSIEIGFHTSVWN